MLVETNQLSQQIQFILEIDKLKLILRQTLLTDSSRRENTAEHSWHIAVMAIVLGEYAPPGTDICRVIKMLLVHDLVEIDAGDTFCYDRIQPFLHNYKTEGGTWRIHGISREQVMKRMAPVEVGAPKLWAFVLQLIDDSVTAGYLL